MSKRISRWLTPSENLRVIEVDMVAADDAYALATNKYKAALLIRGDVLLQARETLKRARRCRLNCQHRLANAKKNWRPDTPLEITQSIALNEVCAPDDCIEWTGNTNRGGYGIVYIKGRKRLAHRLAYAAANSLKIEDLDGVVIRHRCDNPLCIRPEHLLPGTQADNVKDMYERSRNVQNTARGSAAASSKLKESDIPIIRARLSAGERRGAIAADYGVARGTIFRIQSRKTWAHV